MNTGCQPPPRFNWLVHVPVWGCCRRHLLDANTSLPNGGTSNQEPQHLLKTKAPLGVSHKLPEWQAGGSPTRETLFQRCCCVSKRTVHSSSCHGQPPVGTSHIQMPPTHTSTCHLGSYYPTPDTLSAHGHIQALRPLNPRQHPTGMWLQSCPVAPASPCHSEVAPISSTRAHVVPTTTPRGQLHPLGAMPGSQSGRRPLQHTSTQVLLTDGRNQEDNHNPLFL